MAPQTKSESPSSDTTSPQPQQAAAATEDSDQQQAPLQDVQPQRIGQCPLLTTTAGAPWINNNDALTAGARGPILLQDYQLIEKLAHQNRERVAERTVHAKGWGAFGVFRITKDISKYTCAKCLQPGKTMPMIARFSTVAGELGAADLERDVRGFALKMYTEEGNWDMVGNNTPIFFVRDPNKFPDFVHALKRHPQTHLRSPTALWDFWSLSPECLHQVTYLMGDRGLPSSFVHMNGYGSHTYSLWNDKGERFWVKFHFKTMQGITYLSNEEAERITGRSRDTVGEDLFNRIDRGEFPKWKFQIQIMTEQEACNKELGFNPFDLTKVWPHRQFPLIDVGEFELNRNPHNYFAEIEQLAFSPSNVVPGISWSPDKMLQSRLFAYADAHRYRLGANYDQLPVNLPRCPMANYHRDGLMNTFGGIASGNQNAFYEPNSFGGPVEGGKRVQEPPLAISGDANYYSHRSEDWDDYSQVRKLYTEVMKPDARQRLHKNLAGSLQHVPVEIVERALAELKRIHVDYEAGVRREWEKIEKKPEMYNANGMPVTQETPHMVSSKGAPLRILKSTLDQLAEHESHQPLRAATR